MNQKCNQLKPVTYTHSMPVEFHCHFSDKTEM